MDVTSQLYAMRPWTEEEHNLFLEALEQFGNGNSGMEWNKMAQHIGTRNYNEVKLHAHKYFLKLQAKKASNNHTNGTVLQQRTARWTMEEDIIFEGSLAACLRGSSKASPLERGKDFAIEISKALPGKTALEIKERIRLLVADIANIEAGKSVVMAYHGMFQEKNTADSTQVRGNLSVAAAGDRFAEAACAAAKQDNSSGVMPPHTAILHNTSAADAAAAAPAPLETHNNAGNFLSTAVTDAIPAVPKRKRESAQAGSNLDKVQRKL